MLKLTKIVAVVSALAMTTSLCTVASASDLSYDGYTLKWQDDFTGAKLNRADWNVELHEPGWVNNELQEYVDSEDNIYQKDGLLVIRPLEHKNPDGSVSYTSGRITTQNKHDFKYGIFEARIKVPSGQGLWPAFWMMPTDENFYNYWLRCGEIDIMEVLGHDTAKSYGTIHFGDPHGQSQGVYEVKEGEATLDRDFHDYAVEWEPSQVNYHPFKKGGLQEKFGCLDPYSLRRVHGATAYSASKHTTLLFLRILSAPLTSAFRIIPEDVLYKPRLTRLPEK